MAAHAQGERTPSLRRAMTRPTASPAPRKTSMSLFSRPIPVTSPSALPESPSSPAKELR